MGSDRPKELADQINVSDTSVRKYLKGAVPSLDIGARIADVYGGVITKKGPEENKESRYKNIEMYDVYRMKRKRNVKLE